MSDEEKPGVSLEARIAAIAVATPLVQQVSDAMTAMFNAEGKEET
ncbi:hypothetical protein [Microbacterium sp. UCD-TDU]|nr:hypothetical protein [Microbacterium sp. UCD-TDU]